MDEQVLQTPKRGSTSVGAILPWEAMSEGDPRDNEKFLEAEKWRLYEQIRNYPTPRSRFRLVLLGAAGFPAP